MANLEFAVPYNNDPETLKEIFRLKKLGSNRIREIYLHGPQEYSGSGRVSPEIKMNEFVEIVDKIHKEGIRVNLLLNSTCEGSEWDSPKVVKSKMEYLKQVHKEHGVEAVTIANPLYIKEVRRRFPDIEICASVLGDIDCVQRAVIYRKAGADVITPDVNINRDFKLLKEIKEATNAELRLVLNEGCLYKCPFRKFHFNYISFRSKEPGEIKGDVFPANCTKVIVDNYSQILKSCWIMPEDTNKYSEITSFFKIVGRTKAKDMVIRATRAYLEESWDVDLLDMCDGSLNMFGIRYSARLDSKGLEKYNFFEKVTSCDKNCSQCSYCEELAMRLISFGTLTRKNMEDLGLKHIPDGL
ncbi:U32 family peptidase [Chloroflexota bacterium]